MSRGAKRPISNLSARSIDLAGEVANLPTNVVRVPSLPVDLRVTSPRQIGVMRRNVRRLNEHATPEQREQGMDWYRQANRYAQGVGLGDTNKGAGILSTLSPQTRWDSNVEAATQLHGLPTAALDEFRSVLEHPGARTGADPGAKSEFQRLNSRARQRVLPGTSLNNHPTSRIVQAGNLLEGIQSPEATFNKGVKTDNFFRNILDPEDPSHVTIDAHAHDIALGAKLGYKDANGKDVTKRNLGATSRYNLFADQVYKPAAHDLGVLPNQAQAVAWTVWPKKGEGGPMPSPSQVADRSRNLSRRSGRG